MFNIFRENYFEILEVLQFKTIREGKTLMWLLENIDEFISSINSYTLEKTDRYVSGNIVPIHIDIEKNKKYNKNSSQKKKVEMVDIKLNNQESDTKPKKQPIKRDDIPEEWLQYMIFDDSDEN